MGAAGLTSSSVEMASKGGVGLKLVMDAVPCRETGMTPYEMMLSESQERMLMVLKPGAEPQAEAIFRKWALDFAVIGEVTDSGRLQLHWKGEMVADLPLAPIADDAPKYDRPWVPTPPQPALTNIPVSNNLMSDLQTLLASPDGASRRWIWEQYDHMVGADTVQRPGGDAAVVRVHGTPKGLAITADCTPRYCFADPVEGGKQAIAEAWRNLTAVGATPLAVTDCMNFAAPTRPEVMGQFVGCIEGMAEACRALDFPVVSGNVSLYNETEGQGILPTPAIGAVGLLRDWSTSATIAFKADGDEIWLVGGSAGHLGQSLWLREVHGREEGPPPPVDLAAERAAGDWVRARIDEGSATAVHDLADGGLLVALAEMAMAGGTGATVRPAEGLSAAAWAFGEDQGRYLLTVKPGTALPACPVPLARIGTTGGLAIHVEGAGAQDVAALRVAHEAFLPELMAR
jgi:phosphoribosylformylglycinamidine synthase